MIKIFLMTIYLVYCFNLRAETLSEEGYFAGRISRINYEISVARIKVDFDNVKYLNPKDKIEFWDEKSPSFKCKAYILGRSADYLLVKVPELKYCEKHLYFTTGSYFKFYSEDLKNNIVMGREVVGILLKKRLAVDGKLSEKEKDLVSHAERVNTVNSRFQSLRAKLEQEWKKELLALEEDKAAALRVYKDLERRRDEIDQKLEQYKVNDDNLTLDRWSLDSNLYYKK